MDWNQTLTEQLDALTVQLAERGEEKNTLLGQRFDLKEQRRYFRAQLRDARREENLSRIEQIECRLGEITQQLEALENELQQVEEEIEGMEAEMEELLDRIDQPKAPTYDHEERIQAAVDRINRTMRKGFLKMADRLEQLDFDKMSEDVRGAATKAAETVSGAANDAAKSVEVAWKATKENWEQPGGIGDYRISGSGVIDGGCYNHIVVSGSCKISSDLICRELKVSGALHACGGVDCSGMLRGSGSIHCEGRVLAGSFHCSGGGNLEQDLESGAIRAAGGLHIKGSLKGTEVRCTGGLRVGGDIEAEHFSSIGMLQVEGMINAETVQIQLGVSPCRVGSIGGGAVHVTQGSRLLALNPCRLSCDSIEGDQIDLELVHAKVVRGGAVTIRRGCEIDQIEYTESCTIEDGAKVTHLAKV